MNTARAHLEAEMARNARLRKILGLSEIDTEVDSEKVVAAKLLERAGAFTMIAALVSTPRTGAAEVERRAKLRALRADGWIPEGEDDSSPGDTGECDPVEKHQPQPQTVPITGATNPASGGGRGADTSPPSPPPQTEAGRDVAIATATTVGVVFTVAAVVLVAIVWYRCWPEASRGVMTAAAAIVTGIVFASGIATLAATAAAAVVKASIGRGRIADLTEVDRHAIIVTVAVRTTFGTLSMVATIASFAITWKLFWPLSLDAVHTAAVAAAVIVVIVSHLYLPDDFTSARFAAAAAVAIVAIVWHFYLPVDTSNKIKRFFDNDTMQSFAEQLTKAEEGLYCIIVTHTTGAREVLKSKLLQQHFQRREIFCCDGMDRKITKRVKVIMWNTGDIFPMQSYKLFQSLKAQRVFVADPELMGLSSWIVRPLSMLLTCADDSLKHVVVNFLI
jgi:hypothetical protein